MCIKILNTVKEFYINMHSCAETLNKSGLPETTKGNFIQIQNVSNYYFFFRYSQNEIPGLNWVCG